MPDFIPVPSLRASTSHTDPKLALCSGVARRDLTRTVAGKDAEIESLSAKVASTEQEVQIRENRLMESEARVEQKAEEVKAAREKEQQLQSTKRALEEEVAKHERRIQEEEEKRLAKEAAEGPPPAAPEEVRREVLEAFDTAVPEVCRELAAQSGVMAGDAEMAGGSSGEAGSSSEEGEEPFVVGENGLDAASMLDAGVPVQEMAVQYLQQAMKRATKAVEPAKLQAVAKWRNELKKRRMLQDQLQELKGSIRVMCRIRPADAGEETAVSVNGDSDVVLTQPGKDGRKSFTFDHVFGATSKQAQVFEEVEPVLDSVLSGFNVCIFAYGQTGSGKTFTMEGAKRSDSADLAGINPRALARLFELIADKQQLAAIGGGNAASADDGWSYEVQVSYLEIYNENLRDLLSTPTQGPDKGKRPSQSLDVRSVPGVAVSVPGLTTVGVKSAAEVEAALQRGAGRRSVSATKCNSESSRSHSIVMVNVTGRNSVSGATTHGKLHLVDLAGSERVKKSEVSGQGMAEAQHINKSLSALGTVMASLQEKSKHIPFRDSKLTQLLADSLGGNSKTFMFVNVNPSSGAASETLCSLGFAARVRRVELGKASGKRVEGASLAELRAAKTGEEQARSELVTANARLAELEREVSLSREAQAALETQLATARASHSEYKETEEVLAKSEAERQRRELADEKKRSGTLEARLNEMCAKLAAAEKQAAAAKAQAAEAERQAADAIASAGSSAAEQRATPQQRAEALSALRASASQRLTAASAPIPPGSGAPPSVASQSAMPPSSFTPAAPLAPLSFAGAAPSTFPSPAPAAFAATPAAAPEPTSAAPSSGVVHIRQRDAVPPSPMVLPPPAAAATPAPPTPTLVPPTPVPVAAAAAPPSAPSAASATRSSAPRAAAPAPKPGAWNTTSSAAAAAPAGVSTVPLIPSTVPVTLVPVSNPSGGGSLLSKARNSISGASSMLASVFSGSGASLMDAPNIMDAPLMEGAAGTSHADTSHAGTSHAGAEALNSGMGDIGDFFAQAEAEANGTADVAPNSNGKRPSPTSAAAAPNSTPSKRQAPRYTPSKLSRPEGGECVRSAKKSVKFQFSPAAASAASQPAFADLDESHGVDADDADSIFPMFSLDKENPGDNSGRSSNGSEAGSAGGFKKTLSSVVGNAAAGSETKLRQFSLGGSGLGGAARVIVNPKLKRNPRDRQTIAGSGSSIGKPAAGKGGGGSQRRMSLAAQQAVEQASGRNRPNRTIWDQP